MVETRHYDAIVIGSGQAGGPLSTALANAGKKTALIEREHIGGTCINEGCTPTKTMVASARVAYLARRGSDYGVETGPIKIEMETVRKRKRDIVESFRGGSEHRIINTKGLDLLRGEASFVDAKTIDVKLNDGQVVRLTGESFFINAGARPGTPRVEGINEVPVLNSTSIMELDSVPEHLVIIGGGYIALEFGQMFRRFGSEVTIIQRGKQLLAREDQDVAEEVAKILREDGITILLEANTSRISKTSNDRIQVSVNLPSGERTIVGSHLLAAAGRVPNTDSLHMENAGVALDKGGFIKVNDQLETNVPGIYALGDVKGGPAFTHISYDDFRIIRTNIIQNGHASIKDRLVPYTVFMDPQLGRVGLNETEAKEQGRTIKVAKLPMSSVARALETDETRGFMKAIVDVESEQILGAMVLGVEGGEIMGALQMAMIGKVRYTVIRDSVFAHPTLVESLNNLFMSLDE